jgi:hypothetical protein
MVVAKTVVAISSGFNVQAILVVHSLFWGFIIELKKGENSKNEESNKVLAYVRPKFAVLVFLKSKFLTNVIFLNNFWFDIGLPRYMWVLPSQTI